VPSKIRDFVRFHIKRGLKFAIVGSIGAVINLLVLFLLTEYAKTWYIASEILAIFVAFIFNYFVNTYWTYLDAMKALKREKID
jgi:putative flippase GtrA